MDEGYIKLHRSLLEHPVFTCGDAHLFQLFTYCLLRANWKDTDVIIGNQVVHLKRGQFVTGRESLFRKLVVPQDKRKGFTKNEQQKWGFLYWRKLKLLEKLQILHIKSTNKYTIVTIINYRKYQDDAESAQHLHNNATTDAQHLHTDKNIDIKSSTVDKQQTLSRGLGVQGERGLSLPNGLSGINYRIQEDFTDLKAFLKEDDESLRQKAEEKWFKQAARDVGMSVEQFKRSIS